MITRTNTGKWESYKVTIKGSPSPATPQPEDNTPAGALILDAVAVDVTPATGKIPAVKFELLRAEGLIEETGPAAPVTTWAEADNILRNWARTAPQPGHGYDKCDFKITYADGDTYEGRYDLKFHDQTFPELLAWHIRQHCEFYAGTRRPDWMTEDKYQDVLASYEEETIQGYKDFIARYEIGDPAGAPEAFDFIPTPAPEPEPTTEPEQPKERITDTTLIAKLTRAELKKVFPDCKFSVTSSWFSGGSEITVALMSAPFEVLGDNPSWPRKESYAQLNQFTLREDFEKHAGDQVNYDGWYTVPDGYAVCNGAYITRQGWEVLQKAVQIANVHNWDNSDPQTDYFDVNYYFSINVGKFDKPFEVKVK